MILSFVTVFKKDKYFFVWKKDRYTQLGEKKLHFSRNIESTAKWWTFWSKLWLKRKSMWDFSNILFHAFLIESKILGFFSISQGLKMYKESHLLILTISVYKDRNAWFKTVPLKPLPSIMNFILIFIILKTYYFQLWFLYKSCLFISSNRKTYENYQK